MFLVLTCIPGSANEQASTGTGAIDGVLHLSESAPPSQIVIFLSAGEGQAIVAPTTAAKISQLGATFRPPMLVVCVHQAVDFLNDEDRLIEHNVFSNSPTNQFDLGLFKPGEKRTVTFDRPGPVLLYCSIHRHMDGVVYVSPTPYFQVLEPDGSEAQWKFKVEGVPPGRWIVQTWQRRRRYREASSEVIVQAGQRTAVELQLGKR